MLNQYKKRRDAFQNCRTARASSGAGRPNILVRTPHDRGGRPALESVIGLRWKSLLGSDCQTLNDAKKLCRETAYDDNRFLTLGIVISHDQMLAKILTGIPHIGLWFGAKHRKNPTCAPITYETHPAFLSCRTPVSLRRAVTGKSL